MHMVLDAADLNQMSFLRSNDSSYVFVEPFAQSVPNSLTTVFGAEYDVVGEFGECPHDPAGLAAVAATRLGGDIDSPSMGLRPRLHAAVPSGLSYRYMLPSLRDYPVATRNPSSAGNLFP